MRYVSPGKRPGRPVTTVDRVRRIVHQEEARRREEERPFDPEAPRERYAKSHHFAVNAAAHRFRVGSLVVMTPDALENYGANWRGVVFRVIHVATAYMPASEFFSRGQPAGYHPGFDADSDSALYDLAVDSNGEAFGNSLYDWELAPAPRRRAARR